jgi:signal transduction histidine kinase/DNA-binding response OmpR family regulator/PAS domain-containing protein
MQSSSWCAPILWIDPVAQDHHAEMLALERVGYRVVVVPLPELPSVPADWALVVWVGERLPDEAVWGWGVPVVMVSGCDRTDLKVAAFQRGVVDYLTLPCDPAELVVRVNARLGIIPNQIQTGIVWMMDRLLKQWSQKTGNPFFQDCTQDLAHGFNVRYVSICEVWGTQPSRVRSRIFWDGATWNEGQVYVIDDSPCQQVIRGEICYVPTDVPTHFPQAAYLVAAQANGYLGLPLHNSAQEVIGVLVLMDGRPLILTDAQIAGLRRGAAHIALELERQLVTDRLAHQATLAAMMANISRQLMDAPLQESLGDILAQVAEQIRADRAYLFWLDSENPADWRILRCWAQPEWHCPMADRLDMSPFTYTLAALQANPHQAFYVPWVEAMPPEAAGDRDLMRQADIQSLLVIPLNHDHQTRGYLCIEACTIPQYWSEEEQNWLVLLGELLAAHQYRHQARQDLEQSHAQYETLAANMPGMIYQMALSPAGVVTFPYVSPSCQELLGIPALDLMTQFQDEIFQWVHPEDLEPLWMSIHESARTLAPWHHVWRWFKGTALHWMQGRSRPQRQADGTVVWDGILVDITVQKEAELAIQATAESDRLINESINRIRQSLDLNTIFNATSQELRNRLQCDRVVIYRFNNDWSGSVVAEAVVDPWQPLISLANPQRYLQSNLLQDSRCALQALIQTDPLPYINDTYLQTTQGKDYQSASDYRCVHDVNQANFSPCYLDFLATFQAKAYVIMPIFVGTELWGLVGVYQNSGPRHWQSAEITILLHLSHQLSIALQQAYLLDHAQHQAHELQKAKEAADAASLAKSQFLANMSHELRTPLNAVLGFAQLLDSDLSLSPTQKHYLQIINQSGEHLLMLINDVLELSKIEAGQLALERHEFDLYHLVNMLYAMLHLKAETQDTQFQIEIAPDVPQYIYEDQRKLRQVLINLVGNAIKFTVNGKVKLVVTLVRSSIAQQYELRFEVQDTGCGLPESALDRIFEAFTQEPQPVQTTDGTGLGLPISQKFVQLMGGKIEVESVEGQGSVFFFQLPLWDYASASSCSLSHDPVMQLQQIVGLASGTVPPRILIVEDEADNRFLLTYLLESIGFRVKAATHGERAIALWQEWQPQLIMIDIQIPGLDGLAVTRQIRQADPSLPIFALTAFAFDSDRQRALDAGCTAFFSKPFNSQQLLQVIGETLGLTYDYINPHEVQARPSLEGLTPAMLDLMPAEWRSQLHAAAEQCSEPAIRLLLTELPDHAALLKHTLLTIVENYDFDRILNLTAANPPDSP